MSRIICVGNRFVPGDDLGSRVFDALARLVLPPGVDVVDGGLGGLDLARLAEGQDRLVFVDAIRGFGSPGEVRILTPEEAGALEAPPYGHASGLAYLLSALPVLFPGTTRQAVYVAGAEPPVSDRTFDDLLRSCVAVAAAGRGGMP
ncbi:MAG: hydrogenase maturation protease [Candidatus Schekmanbacteria bacterium]|nr:hydrogenase maturation protease [Candidatus Schekmanbacteria bacterium]